MRSSKSLMRAIVVLSFLSSCVVSQDFTALVDHGVRALESGTCKEARADLEQALNRSRNTAEQFRAGFLLGDALLCVGEYDNAQTVAERMKELAGSGDSSTLAHIDFLLAESAKGKGQYADADSKYAEVVRRIKPVSPPDSLTYRYLAGWGELARLEGDFTASEDRIKQASASLDQSGAPDGLARGYLVLLAGDLARDREIYPEARDRYTEVSSLVKAKEHPIFVRASTGLGLVELAVGKPDAAEAALKQADASARRTTTSDAFLESADALGLLDLAKGNLKEASGQLKYSLENHVKLRGEQHPGTAICRDDLGRVYLAQQQIDLALDAFKHAEAIERATLGAEHLQLALTLEHLGVVYRKKGDLVAAFKSLDEALAIQTAKLGRNSLAGASTRLEQANVWMDRKRPGEAEPLYGDALSTQKSLGMEKTVLYAATLQGLGLALHAQAKDVEAERFLQQWMLNRGKGLAILDSRRLPVQLALAQISLSTHKLAAAEAQFSEIVNGAGNPAPDAAVVTAAQKGFADTLLAEQKWKDAAHWYETALPKLADQPDIWRGWADLARCYSSQKQWAESDRAFKAAFDNAKKTGAPQTQQTAILLAMIGVWVEANRIDQASPAIDQWLGQHQTQSALLTHEDLTVLEKVGQQLSAAHSYARAERVLRLLLAIADGPAPLGVNTNEVLLELAQTYAGENKRRDAADTYERLANRMRAVRRPADAAKYLLSAKTLREKDADPKDLSLVSTIQALADIYLLDHKYSDAKLLLEQAGALLDEHGVGDDAQRAAVLNDQGMIAQAEKNYEQAGGDFDKAYAILTKLPAPPERLLASVLFNIGMLRMSDGKTAEANEAFQRCLQLAGAKFSADNPPPVDEFDRIADAYVMEGRVPDAEKLYQSNLSRRREFYGEKSADAAWGLYSLAVFYNSSKAYDKAASAGEEALSIFEATAGPESDEVGFVLDVLSSVYHATGNVQKAIAATERCAEIQERLGHPRSEVNTTLSALAEYYRGSKQYQDALKVYQKMADLWKEESFRNPNYLTAAKNIAITYVYLGDFTSGQDWYAKLHTALKQEPLQQAKVDQSYAEALKANGRDKEAKKILDHAENRPRK